MNLPNEKLINLAKKFDIPEEIVEIKPIDGGLINSTYLVKTKDGARSYVMQKKNANIFKNIPEMMRNMQLVTDHLRKKTIENGGDPETEVLTVITTPDGKPYFKDEEGGYWTMTLFIPDTVTCEGKADTKLAKKGGEGIGKFQMLLSDFTTPLYPTIEGFHDLEYRHGQWKETVERDLGGRKKDVEKEIQWIEDRWPDMLKFWGKVKSGEIPKRVTHNDTKISNILFDKKGDVLCVIDLDTVMSNTLLADYGDAIRTFANTTREDDPDLSKVSVDLDIFKNYTEGYLEFTKNILTESEKESLLYGPIYIVFEQALRFLMDYIDGDKYYKTEYPEHNLDRTRNQMRLLEDIEDKRKEMTEMIKDILEKK